MKNTFTAMVRYSLLDDPIEYKKCTSLMPNMGGFIIWSDGKSYSIRSDAEITINCSDDYIYEYKKLKFYEMIKEEFGEDTYLPDSKFIVDACLLKWENDEIQDMAKIFDQVLSNRREILGDE